jgi:hypothetical protein
MFIMRNAITFTTFPLPVSFNFLTAVSMKITVFLEVTPCSLVETYRRFREYTAVTLPSLSCLVFLNFKIKIVTALISAYVYRPLGCDAIYSGKTVYYVTRTDIRLHDVTSKDKLMSRFRAVRRSTSNSTCCFCVDVRFKISS